MTGIFLVLNTHDLNSRSAGNHLPSIYLRDLDPDASPSENNSDLLFERAPARLVQEQSIATDKSWSPPSPIRRWPEAFSMRRSRRPMTMVPS